MTKKILSGLLCAILILAFVPFTVSAADSADFKLCVASQDDKSVTITLDFEKGTGFNAFDASIEYNSLKLSLVSCQFASGFAAFKSSAEKQGGATIFNANDKENPIRVAIVTTAPFKKVNDDGALLKLKFSKIEGITLSDSDITLTIDNCQNSAGEDIKANVGYDLTTGSSSLSSEETVEGGLLPEENAQMPSGTPSENSTENSMTEPSSQSTEAQKKENAEKSDKADSADGEEDEKGISDSKKGVVMIILGVIALAGIILLAAMIIKNKKLPADLDD